jgi:hypothetical protein
MLKWLRPKQLNPWGNWSVQLYFDPESLETFNKLRSEGLRNDLRKDEDGYFANFSRPSSKVIRGRTVLFDPPVVIDNDGKPLTEDVGNGSMGTLKLMVYPFNFMNKSGIAARWEAVKVTDFKPFNKDQDFTPSQEKQLGKLDQKTGPEF